MDGDTETDITSAPKAAKGATVKLELTPDATPGAGSALTALTVTGQEHSDAEIELTDETPEGSNKVVRTFIMPEEAVDVNVTFKNIQTITTEKETVTVAYGDTANVGASAKGEAKLTYASSDENIVKVDASGKLTPVNVGSAIVTVTADETPTDGTNYLGATKDVPVTVTQRPLTVTAADKEKT